MSTETTQQVSASSNSAAFVSAWKKAAGPQKQLTLQTKSEAFTKFCLEEGWGLKEMKTFQQLLEATKYAVPTHDGCPALSLLGETLSFAEHLEVHPIALISFARSVVGVSSWDMSGFEITRAYLENEENHDAVPPGVVSTGDEVLEDVAYNHSTITEHTSALSDDDTEAEDGGKRKRRLFPLGAKQD